MEVFCVNNSSYNTGNDITLAGSSNTSTYNALFQFFQGGNLSINYGSLTTQGIINNGDLIVKSVNNSTSLTSGSLQLLGGASINKNLFVGGNIYFGETTSNSDSMYISRTNLAGNITEIAVFLADDETNTFIILSGETSYVDYFSIRSSIGLHHIFSSTGNYYAGNNINGIIIP